MLYYGVRGGGYTAHTQLCTVRESQAEAVEEQASTLHTCSTPTELLDVEMATEEPW